MAGKRVLEVLLVGDSTGMERAMDRAASAAQKAAGHAGEVGGRVDEVSGKLAKVGDRGRESFGSLSEFASRSGQNLGLLPDVFDRISVAIDSVQEKSTRAGRALAGIGSLAAGIGGIALFAHAHDEESARGLENAVNNLKLSFAEYREELERAANAQARYGHSNDEATRSLEILTTASRDPRKAIDDLQLASNLAAKEHISLGEAAQQVASVYGGNFKVLRQFGHGMADLVDTSKQLEKAHQEESAAVAHVQSAQQRLADFEAVLAQSRTAAAERHAENVTNADRKVEESSEHLADARRHLADVEAAVAERTKLTVADQFQLADAQTRLRDVQQRIADGDLKGADAAMALRDANTDLARVQAEQAEKQKLSLSDQRQLRDASEDVTKAQKSHTEAVQKAAAVRAEAVGGPTLQQLQQERRLRADLQKALGEQAKAEQDLAKAKQQAADQGSKVQQALQMLSDDSANAAADHAKGALGQIRHWVAEVENFFGSMSTSTAMTLLLAGSGISGVASIAGQVGSAFRGAAAAATASAAVTETAAAATIAAEEGVAVASEAAGAATTIGLGPIILIVAAIALAAYELHKHWDTVWGAIKKVTHEAGHVLGEVFGGIESAAGHLKDAFVRIFADLTWPIRTEIHAVIWLVNKVIDALDGIHFSAHLPSWLGGWGFDFNGFGIPHLPDIPSFDTGGVITGGPIGSPKLILAHVGETVLPTHKETPSYQRGARMATVVEHRVSIDHGGLVVLDERTARVFADRISPDIVRTLNESVYNGQALNFVSQRR